LKDLISIPFSDEPPLSEAFFDRGTLQVARDLLGCHLLRYSPDLLHWLRFRVVETEAYTADDPACHAYNRKTGRAEMLYSHPGTAYVYLIYGMYNCLNVVTESHGVAGAVLFRALEPLAPASGLGEPLPLIPLKSLETAKRTNGPGRLCRALQIDRATFNGLPLTQQDSGLYLAAGPQVANENVVQATRIGITKAADFPWRFYIQDNPWVSVSKG